MPTREWPNEREDELRKLWLSGLSIRDVAARMDGNPSRDTVRLKARELGLPRHGRAKEEARRIKPNADDAQSAVVLDFATRQRARGVTILELRDHHCRFLLDEVDGDDRLYCGCRRSTASKLMFCEAHLNLVLQARNVGFQEAAE